MTGGDEVLAMTFLTLLLAIGLAAQVATDPGAAPCVFNDKGPDIPEGHEHVDKYIKKHQVQPHNALRVIFGGHFSYGFVWIVELPNGGAMAFEHDEWRRGGKVRRTRIAAARWESMLEKIRSCDPFRIDNRSIDLGESNVSREDVPIWQADICLMGQTHRFVYDGWFPEDWESRPVEGNEHLRIISIVMDAVGKR